MTYTANSESRLPKLKNVIKDQLIHAEHQHRTSVLDNKCLSRQLISGQQDLQRNYRKRILDPSKLLLKLDQHPSPYDSPNNESCTPCISCFPIRTLNSKHNSEL